MPYSGGVLFSTAVRNGWIHTQPSLSRLLYPDLKCKKPLPCAFTPVAVNPNNRKQIVTGGNDYNCSAIQGYYESTDAST